VNYYLYGLKVSIGTPAANGTLLVLNDHKTSYIYAKNCEGCGRPAFYDPTKSSTFVQPQEHTKSVSLM
jgi:hypothetical protein